MDVLKASFGSLTPHKEQGLLGALAPSGDRGGGFPFLQQGFGSSWRAWNLFTTKLVGVVQRVVRALWHFRRMEDGNR